MGDMAVEELKEKKMWFLWSAKPAKNGKVTKVPYSASGGATGTNDAHSGTWVSFDDADAARNEFQASGIGMKIPKSFFLLDIDHRDIDGKPHFVYSWKLEPMDKLPKGKKPCLSLRELEKQVDSEIETLPNMADGQMTVCELVDRYLKTKTGVRQSTKQGYVTVQRVLAKEPFGKKTIRSVKTSDAKLFLIKLQQEDGKSYRSIHTIRGVLRPAFRWGWMTILL